MKFIVYSSFLFLLAPCNASKTATKTESSGTKTEAAIPAETKTTAASKIDLRTVSFELQRSACFGKCPVFTLNINGATNTATFKGDANTEKIGNYQKKITDEELTALVTAFQDNNFFGMLDEYNKSQVTDLPSTYVTYSVNGKTKKIKDRFQAPAELKQLEKLLTDFANSEGWTKTE